MLTIMKTMRAVMMMMMTVMMMMMYEQRKDHVPVIPPSPYLSF